MVVAVVVVVVCVMVTCVVVFMMVTCVVVMRCVRTLMVTACRIISIRTTTMMVRGVRAACTPACLHGVMIRVCECLCMHGCVWDGECGGTGRHARMGRHTCAGVYW